MDGALFNSLSCFTYDSYADMASCALRCQAYPVKALTTRYITVHCAQSVSSY